MSASRRVIAGFIRIILVICVLLFVRRYFRHRGSDRGGDSNRVTVQKEAPPPSDSLGAGDMRILNADSSVDLVLVGNKILAGLSAKTVKTVKTALDTAGPRDTSGFGGSIAALVKKEVAGAIGTHAVFQLSDIRDIRYDHDQIVFDWNDGKKHELFGGTNVNGRKVSNSFRPDDAQRFIDAVRARKAAPVQR